MAVERLDPSRVAVAGGDAEDVARYVESDFRIRSGLCPNGCGPLVGCSYGQECPSCQFSCNTLREH